MYAPHPRASRPSLIFTITASVQDADVNANIWVTQRSDHGPMRWILCQCLLHHQDTAAHATVTVTARASGVPLCNPPGSQHAMAAVPVAWEVAWAAAWAEWEVAWEDEGQATASNAAAKILQQQC